MWIALPLIVVIGGGYFYLEYMSKPSPVPETGVKVVKKEAKVLKKLLKKDEEKALKQEKPAVTAKKTEAVEKKVVKKKPVAEEKELVVTAKKAEPPKEKVPAAKPAVKKEKEPVKKAEVKKEAEVKKKAEVPPPISYAIHAGSYRKKKTADAEARRLKKKGFDAYAERTDLTKLGKKGFWFRVKIGRFSSREEARKMQKELKRKDKISSRVIWNRPL
jgi:cell division protein FtsN